MKFICPKRPGSLTALVLSDDVDVADFLAQIIRQTPNINAVCAQAGTPRGDKLLANSRVFDVFFVDAKHDARRACKVIKKLNHLRTEVPIVVLKSYRTDEELERLLETPGVQALSAEERCDLPSLRCALFTSIPLYQLLQLDCVPSGMTRPTP